MKQIKYEEIIAGTELTILEANELKYLGMVIEANHPIFKTDKWDHVHFRNIEGVLFYNGVPPSSCERIIQTRKSVFKRNKLKNYTRKIHAKLMGRC